MSGHLDDLVKAQAYLSDVRELRIVSVYESLTLPIRLYSTSWTLETLILQRVHLDVVHTEVTLPFLKTLHLLSVRFSEEKDVENLLSTCPILEDLIVRRTKYVNVIMYTIDVPTLKSLSIKYTYCGDRVGVHGFVINAPSLMYLNIRDYISDVLQFGHMPQLVKASFDIACNHSYKFLGSALELNSILENSPRLEILNLKLKHCVRYSSIHPKDRSIPECLLSRLEMFEWRHYKGTKQEKKVAKYILANATCLKMATFSSLSTKKKHIFNKLRYVARGSQACQLVFQ